MAARIERLFQDRNLNGAVSGKAKKCGAGGGRKPLGDLSNAGKPINQAGGKKALDVSVNRHLKQINASEKSLTARRKALSDISNSVVEPHVREIRGKHSLKPLREEPLGYDAIAEEGMLHNHEECIKSNSGAMYIDHLVKEYFVDPWAEAELLIMKSESARIELEEERIEPEYVSEVFPWPERVSAHPGSPERCNTPECSTMWDEFEVYFKLIESP